MATASDTARDYPLVPRTPPGFPLPELPREGSPMPVELTVQRAVVESDAKVDLEQKTVAEPDASPEMPVPVDSSRASHSTLTLVADAPVIDHLYIPKLYGDAGTGYAPYELSVPHEHEYLREPVSQHGADAFPLADPDLGYAASVPLPEARSDTPALYVVDPIPMPEPLIVQSSEETPSPDLVASSEHGNGYVVVHHDHQSNESLSTPRTGSPPVSPRDDAAFAHAQDAHPADSDTHVGALTEMDFRGEEFASTTTRAMTFVSGSSTTADFDVYSYGMPTPTASTHAPTTRDLGSAADDRSTFLGVPQPVIEAVAAVVQDPSVQTAAGAVGTIISALTASPQGAPAHPPTTLESGHGEEFPPVPHYPERPETAPPRDVTAQHSAANAQTPLEMQLPNPYQYSASAQDHPPASHTPQITLPAPHLALPTAEHADTAIDMPLPTPKEVRFADPDIMPYPTPGIPVWGASTVRQERVTVQMAHTDAPREPVADPSPTSDALPSAVEGTTLSSDLAAEYVETITEDVATIGKEVRVPYAPAPEAAPRSIVVLEEEEEVDVVHPLPIGGDVGRPRITHIFEEPLHPGYGEGNADEGEDEFDGDFDHDFEHEHEDAVEWHEDVGIDHEVAKSFSGVPSAPAPRVQHVQYAPFDAHGTVATPSAFGTGRIQKTRAPRPAFDNDAEPEHALDVSARAGDTIAACRCEPDSGRRDANRTVPTRTAASAPAAGFTVRFDCNVSELRTVALALVDDEYCGGKDIDIVVWKIVHITPGGFSEIYEFTGQFGVAVQKYSSTYYSRSVNRLGSLTRITNRGSTVVIHNPEHICDRSRQMRIRNESDDCLDVSIGVVTCEKVFQPLIRHRELPCDEELVTSFRSLSLKAFFIEPGTEECSFETGQFGAIPLDSLGTSVKSRVVKIDMQERNGKFRAVMH